MPEKTREFIVTLERQVRVKITDPDVIERVTGQGGDEWRSQLYDLHTEEDVLHHLAYNCAENGCENAALLDGWADLPAEAVHLERVDGSGELLAVDEVEPFQPRDKERDRG